MVSIKLFGCLLCLVVVVAAQERNIATPNPTKGAFKALRKVYSLCEDSTDMIKCFKVQAFKLTDRALKLHNIKLVDGVSIIKKAGETIDIRSFQESTLPESEVAKMSSSKLDEMIADRANKFMESHELKINVPRLLSFGQLESGRLIEEGRKKMKKFYGPFLGALAIKSGILAMAYHSIAIVAGKALIIGKIALIISAIIGLKKLVTPEGHEKTTYEIVKHPHVSQSHSYSSSHGEFDGHESGGQYHRSLASGDLMMQDRAYRAHVPRV